MKDGVCECLCLGDDCASGAAEETRTKHGVRYYETFVISARDLSHTYTSRCKVAVTSFVITET